MNRQYLKSGHKIIFDNDKFEIVRIVGAGANCVVYEVKKTDQEYTYRYYLKECYPFNAIITRSTDGSLKWADALEKERNVKKFKEAYNTLLDIYNDAHLRNSTSIPMDIYETNGTVYSLNDIKTGTTFEEDASESLSDILETAVALSKLIGKYHKAGYLHLDIKPENIFLLDETRELLVLFDVDSVVSLDRLRNGEIRHISFSENYAAPEQKREKLFELSEQTDIYGIGATLFSKIMGRFVTALDRDIFADWDFDEIPLFKDINPQVKKHIKDIFRKSLSVQPQNRYKNAGELVEALLMAKKACDNEMYLISDYPSVIKNFVGRTDELNKINEAFKNKNNIVFLHGFGGIGKSELSKKFAQVHNNDYDAIIFCTYNGSLINTLDGIYTGNETTNDNKYNFQDKEAILKTLLTENVLLIIDNFDVDINGDEYLFELSKYKANIIITTRTDFSDCQLDCFEQINISTINKKLLNELFIKESGLDKVSIEDKGIIDEILAAYEYHTMFIKPLAYKIKHLGYSIKNLKDEVDEDLLEDKDLIVGIKNNRPYEETLNSLAKKLFKINQLDETKRQILRDLYMLGDIKLSLSRYISELYGDTETSVQKQIRNGVAGLIRRGLIQTHDLDDTLYVHSLIFEIVEKTFSPYTADTCKQVVEFAKNKLQHLIEHSHIYGYNEFSPQSLSGVFLKLDINNKENISFITDFLFYICCTSYDWLVYMFEDVLEKIPDDKNCIKLMYLKFLNIVYTKDFFINPDDTVDLQKDLEKKLVEYIYNYYNIQNKESREFSSIFWKMIILYENLMDSFKYFGWDFNLYSMLKECVINEETNGTTLHDYVFDEICPSAYMNEDGIWIDENELVLAFEHITKRYAKRQKLISKFNISTFNKTGHDIYIACMECMVKDYEKKLRILLHDAADKIELTEQEMFEIQNIYECIMSDEEMGNDYKKHLENKYATLFILRNRKLLYKTMIDDIKSDKYSLFEKIFCDKKIEDWEKDELLCKLLNKVMECYSVEYGYEAQIEIMPYLCKYSDEIILMSKRYNKFELRDIAIYSYFVVDIGKFEELFDKLIEISLGNIREALNKGIFHYITTVSFEKHISNLIKSGKCHVFYSFIRKYLDKVCALDDEYSDHKLFIPLKSLLLECQVCAEAAYRETGEEEYKKEYKRHRERLNSINSKFDF